MGFINRLHLIYRDKFHILLELSDDFLKQTGSSAVEVCTFLKEMGYVLFRASSRQLININRPPTEQCNIVAFNRTAKIRKN